MKINLFYIYQTKKLENILRKNTIHLGCKQFKMPKYKLKNAVRTMHTPDGHAKVPDKKIQ